MKKPVIYMDNAATSFPKPETVYKAVTDAMRHAGGNPGRSGHRMTLAANRFIFEAREAVATLLGACDSSRIIFTSNATEALNLAIIGIVKDGSHVITSNMEHNSASRPLYALKGRGVEVTKIGCNDEGLIDLDELIRSIRQDTSLIACTHASNVIGTIQPLKEIGALARGKGIPFLVDAAQTAGSIPIDVEEMNVDLLAAAGHKSLLGPQGTGLLYIAPHIDLEPLKFGGTGGGTAGDEQPMELPDRFEAGTMNTPGIAGLGAGARFILETGLERIREKEIALVGRLIDGLSRIDGVTIYGPAEPEKRAALVSFNIEGIDPSLLSFGLDNDYGIMTRGGLHCAPDAHRFLGTFPVGCVRLAPGYFNTTEEIDAVVAAINEIAIREISVRDIAEKGTP
ncbi:MAG: aminotransferase class V-fold PLP-dependent enzyme [bacterium]|nr:aminotransferase class V-fold PLP-dependent enzyme [bacterium]